MPRRKTLIRRVRVRALRTLRRSEIGLILCCAIAGCAVAMLVLVLHDCVAFMQRLAFDLYPGVTLGAQLRIAQWRVVLVPLLGGVALAMILRLLPTLGGRVADPIEANALYGGRMSLRGSTRLTALTFVSNGAGASVGMEAGYSQIGAAIFSAVGGRLGMVRDNRRTMVTAGAAAAITAAFNAPLAGIFYGFELVHGGLSARRLAPVVTASICAWLVLMVAGHHGPVFVIPPHPEPAPLDFLLLILLALLGAALAVLAMTSVGLTERLLRRSRIPQWLLPVVGGVMIGLLGLYSPQILGAGLGPIQWHFEFRLSLTVLLALLLAKMLASAVSIGAGFRGGLFSSALLLGALLGACFAQLAGVLLPAHDGPRALFLLAGMAATGAGIVGAPLTISFLVIETTGSFAAAPVLIAVAALSAMLVRLTFGYSFSTWRFHLRGLTLRGAHDIGWISGLTAARLMHRDIPTFPIQMPLASLRQALPLGSTEWIGVSHHDGTYAGMLETARAHDPDLNDLSEMLILGDLTDPPGPEIGPADDVRHVLQTFAASRLTVLPVVSQDRRALGYVSESHCLRRYLAGIYHYRGSDLGF